MPRKKTTNQVSNDVVLLKLEYMQADINDIKKKLDKDFVTQDQYEPVKKIVYGLVSMALVAVAGAVIALVIR